MLYRTLALLSAVALAGCEAGVSVDPKLGGSRADETQAAAFAASAQYPQDGQASEDLRATALVNRDKKTIRILNTSDKVLENVNVWVNGSYVYRVDRIAPNSSVTVNNADFYNRTGKSLGADQAPITRVEVQTGDNQLYRLYGPVYE